jgi:hypothetical protein
MPGRTPVRIDLGPAGLILAVPPPGPAPAADLARAAAELAASPDPAPPAPFAIARAARIDARLGLAVLVARPGRAVLYCPAAEITRHAASGLAALARAVPGITWPGPDLGLVRVRVTRDPHSDLPPGRHPAYLHAVPAGVLTAHVCANLISPGLAADLAVLGTALAGLLPPGTAPGSQPRE